MAPGGMMAKVFSWDGIEAATPEDAALRLGFERNGRVD